MGYVEVHGRPMGFSYICSLTGAIETIQDWGKFLQKFIPQNGALGRERL